MYKLKSLFPGGRSPFEMYKLLYDYMPTNRIGLTDSFSDADLLFLFISAGDPAIFHFDNGSIDLYNMEQCRLIVEKIGTLPRLLYLDGYYPSREGPKSTFPSFTKDTDFIMSQADISNSVPNSYQCFRVDERNFFPSGRYMRIPKTAAIMYDHLMPCTTLVEAILKEVDRLYVLGHNNPPDEVFDEFHDHLYKIEFKHHHWPDGMQRILNQITFTINLKPDHGVEYITVEGGFCGVQPLVPDNVFYRALFSETPTQFFDTSDPDSLAKLIRDFDVFTQDDITKFINRFSARIHAPHMWNSICDKLDLRVQE